MTTAILPVRTWGAHVSLPTLLPFRAALGAWRQRASNVRALARAGRLGPRLLADMGIEEGTARAVVGDWDDLRPNLLLVRPRT